MATSLTDMVLRSVNFAQFHGHRVGGEFSLHLANAAIVKSPECVLEFLVTVSHVPENVWHGDFVVAFWRSQ